MELLSKEQLQARIKEVSRSKRTRKHCSHLEIEETGDGFRIDTLVCTGLPKSESSVLLLICNGLTQDQCAAYLNKSSAHVSRIVRLICLKLLGSNADGNAEDSIAAAILRAFTWAYLYHENLSVFKATQAEWETFITNFIFEDASEAEAARLVFVEGRTIEEAASQSGIGQVEASLAVRTVEQYLGEGLEMIFKASNSQRY